MKGQRTLLVPEVLQSSQMDCGPAALKALLAGFGVDADYDMLRARCQTDVDGTSIDALARLGSELGLTMHQLAVPIDNLLLTAADCLPAIAVTRGGGGAFHFVVLWSTWGPWVQVMDPSGGRRWQHRRSLLQALPTHPVTLSAKRWRRWAVSAHALAPLRSRLRSLGVGERVAEQLIACASADPTWHGFAALDAAVRMLNGLLNAKVIARGPRAALVLQRAFESELESAAVSEGGSMIPRSFWWVRPVPGESGALRANGCVIVHASGCQASAQPSSAKRRLSSWRPRLDPMSSLGLITTHVGERLLAKCLLLLAALTVNAGLTLVEALLLRGILYADRQLNITYQRVAGIGIVFVLMFTQACIELFVSGMARRAGRSLETRVRLLLHHKLPRLQDGYLRTRPVSDVANRASHALVLREIPVLWTRSLRAAFQLVATAGGLIWLFPEGAYLTVMLTVIAASVPYWARRTLAEANLRMRTQNSAIERLYLDALVGVIPVRVHGAERAVRSEHESLLTDWMRSFRVAHRANIWVQSGQLCVCALITLSLLNAYWRSGSSLAASLVLVFWALRMPATAQELAASQLGLRNLRAAVLRLISPLSAPERALPSESACPPQAARPTPAIDLRFRDVSVLAGGHSLLVDLRMHVSAGSHVAIVGPSGAGKSSLLGLLLGFVTPARGLVEIDGKVLTQADLVQLHAETAWVDPAIRLWDSSLYDNLAYASVGEPGGLSGLLDELELHELLEQLDEGMQSRLGEGGARLSGGQGQRVRLSRAWLRRDARLVLLDEPFRGLPHEQRKTLLGRIRRHFVHATLLFVSHDVGDTLGFERVLVVEGGRVVEDDRPTKLLGNPNSRYAQLLHAEARQRAGMWSNASWRQLRLAQGELHEVREHDGA